MMRNILPLIIAIIVTAWGSSAFAQYRVGPHICHEVGLGAGISTYFGDLATDEDGDFPYFSQFHSNNLGPAATVFYRATFNERFGTRLNVSYMRLRGGESEMTEGMVARSLHFRSDVIEIAAIGEINILKYCPGSMVNRFTPYIFGGIGGIYHNPKALYNDEYVALQPLGTEGQGTAAYPDRDYYNKFQAVVPVGLGVKYNVSPRIVLGMEMGHRFTFTDYLDDVSTTYPDPAAIDAAYNIDKANRVKDLSYRTEASATQDVTPGTERGDVDGNDAYFAGQVTVSYAFGGGDNGMGCYSGSSNSARKLKCATAKKF